MYKLAIIGALIAALAVPVSAAGQAPIRPHQAQAQRSPVLAGAMRRSMLIYSAQAKCQTVVTLPGRGYGFCGGAYWSRYGKAGDLTTGPAFWRHERMDRPDDHP